VGRFGGATGNAAAVGLASMFLPPGHQRDCACAYSLTRARPGSYRDRIKPSVCATPAPAVMRYASSPVGGEVCPASRLTSRQRHPWGSEGPKDGASAAGGSGVPPAGVPGPPGQITTPSRPKAGRSWEIEMSTGRFADVAARARSELRALEMPEPCGWDAGGDGVVVITREEMAALRRYCIGDNLRGLMAAAARGWAQRVPAAHRKRRIIDWLIEREAKTWEAVCREVEAEEAAGTLA
jgi:hypothetical protein